MESLLDQFLLRQVTETSIISSPNECNCKGEIVFCVCMRSGQYTNATWTSVKLIGCKAASQEQLENLLFCLGYFFDK